MSVSIFRHWRRRWTVDLPRRTATHECGFTVRFDLDGERVIAGSDDVHVEDGVKLLEHARELFMGATVARELRDLADKIDSGRSTIESFSVENSTLPTFGRGIVEYQRTGGGTITIAFKGEPV